VAKMDVPLHCRTEFSTQEEEWVTEDEVVGWHHRLNRLEFEQTPGESEEQASMVCCDP